MFDTTQKDLLTKAFEIAARTKTAGVGLNIRHHEIWDYEDEHEELLSLLALSPARADMEELRDMLDRALGKPEPVLTPDEELRAAADVFQKHRDSGYLLDIDVVDQHVCWLKREAA